MSNYRSAANLIAGAMPIMAPPPDLSVSEWADRYRMLSAEASAMPGRWRTRTVEYMREPMDCIGDPRYRRVVIVAGSQVAKSEVLLNAIGHTIHIDPAPIMLMQPTEHMAEAFSKDRVATMIRDTPELNARVSSNKSRDSGNTILHKTFPGGHLTMIGANAPTNIASRPIRDVYMDEIDRFPVSAGREGDPSLLAIKRTATFWNRRVVMVSTPTISGESRIWEAYEEGDQRRLHVPCPHCDTPQVLVWANVRWAKGRPETAEYVCDDCGCTWSDAQRVAAIRHGTWIASAPFDGIASFHVPGMLSPFAPLSDGVREFLEAQGKPEKLKTWTNTFLGETWSEQGERVDTHELAARAEDYPDDELPDDITLLTAGVDVQDNRLECEVVGWGDDERSWSVGYHVIHGDPKTPAPWDELTAYLRQSYHHPMFGDLIVRATCLDTGYHTLECYKYAKRTQRVHAIKGIGGEGKAFVGKPSTANVEKCPVFPIGTLTGKDTVMTRLKCGPGDAGYCRFPTGRDIEYFKQLTAEEKTKRYHRGFAKVEWVKMRTRNEAFDCRIYATAALELLAVDLKAQRRALVREYASRVLPVIEPTNKPAGKPLRRAKDSWVSRWKAPLDE